MKSSEMALKKIADTEMLVKTLIEMSEYDHDTLRLECAVRWAKQHCCTEASAEHLMSTLEFGGWWTVEWQKITQIWADDYLKIDSDLNFFVELDNKKRLFHKELIKCHYYATMEMLSLECRSQALIMLNSFGQMVKNSTK